MPNTVITSVCIDGMIAASLAEPMLEINNANGFDVKIKAKIITNV
jgi:hypothetical protein